MLAAEPGEPGEPLPLPHLAGAPKCTSAPMDALSGHGAGQASASPVCRLPSASAPASA